MNNHFNFGSQKNNDSCVFIVRRRLGKSAAQHFPHSFYEFSRKIHSRISRKIHSIEKSVVLTRIYAQLLS